MCTNFQTAMYVGNDTFFSRNLISVLPSDLYYMAGGRNVTLDMMMKEVVSQAAEMFYDGAVPSLCFCLRTVCRRMINKNAGTSCCCMCFGSTWAAC